MSIIPSNNLRIKIPHAINTNSFNFFSPTELSAAEQLVQLSESSNSDDSCSFSTSNTTPVSSSKPPNLLVSIAEYEEEEEEDEMGCRRKNRRYRMIDDLYRVTDRIERPKKPRNLNKEVGE